MRMWKDYFEEMLNVECVKQSEYDDKDDIQKQKEQMINEAIIIEEVVEVI